LLLACCEPRAQSSNPPLIYHSKNGSCRRHSCGDSLLLVYDRSSSRLCCPRIRAQALIRNPLLILFPAALCFSLFHDLVKGPIKLGQAAYNSDLRTLPFLFGFLALAVLTTLRPSWRWLFWFTWLISAIFCSIAVYLTFFWKVFS
jgi:hypothetical protein